MATCKDGSRPSSDLRRLIQTVFEMGIGHRQDHEIDRFADALEVGDTPEPVQGLIVGIHQVYRTGESPGEELTHHLIAHRPRSLARPHDRYRAGKKHRI